jgi:hypothetical protein
MKKLFYLYLTITFIGVALVVIGINLPTGSASGLCIGLGFTMAIGFALINIFIYAQFPDILKSKEEDGFRDSIKGPYQGTQPVEETVRPDVPATRQWVQAAINSATSNCMRVDGDSHKQIESQAEIARGWINLSLAKTQELHTPKMVVLGFGYYKDAIYFELHGIKYKAVTKVGLHDIPTANQDLPSVCSDEEYKAAWEDFDGFWQSNNSVGIMFEAVVRVPLGVDPASQEVGKLCPQALIDAWKACGMPEYKTLKKDDDEFYCKYICNGTYRLSLLRGSTAYYKAY